MQEGHLLGWEELGATGCQSSLMHRRSGRVRLVRGEGRHPQELLPLKDGDTTVLALAMQTLVGSRPVTGTGTADRSTHASWWRYPPGPHASSPLPWRRPAAAMGRCLSPSHGLSLCWK